MTAAEGDLSPAGTVQRLARYPVKSMRGQWCERVEVTDLGVELDRVLAIYGQDGKIASGKTTRRFRRMQHLFELRSWAEGSDVWVETPGGSIYMATYPDGWTAVSETVGEAVEIRPEGTVAHKDAAPIHLITTGSLRWAAALRPGFDDAAERYRPNLVIDTPGIDRPEDTWIGKRLQIGSCVLRVTNRTERCVMPTLAQKDLPFLPGLLSALAKESDSRLGVYAQVEAPGEIAVGDRVSVLL